MIIIEKPYISEMLIDSIVQHDWAVLENEALTIADIEEGAIETIPSQIAKDYYSQINYPLIYSNSENSINWVSENLPDSQLARYIKLFKDKIEFRKMLEKIFPDFYYKEADFKELDSLKVEELKFPFVLKPSVGFLSFGVHTIYNEDDWKATLSKIDKEIILAEKLYPKTVIDSSKFILEEYINGEEFAIDAYYDRDCNPVILNIYQHPFLDSKDVRDRIYLMSTGIMIKYMARFSMLLKEIGDMNDIRNFPMHIELRVTEDDKIVPIEINPMRFAGWCTADVAKYAWGINPYEFFMAQKKPDWNHILENAKRGVYYFSMAEVPSDVDKSKIKDFEYEVYLANFSNVLEVRRINYQKHPLFAVIFGKTESKEEINKILKLNTRDYLEML